MDHPQTMKIANPLLPPLGKGGVGGFKRLFSRQSIVNLDVNGVLERLVETASRQIAGIF